MYLSCGNFCRLGNTEVSILNNCIFLDLYNKHIQNILAIEKAKSPEILLGG